MLLNEFLKAQFPVYRQSHPEPRSKRFRLKQQMRPWGNDI
jgi:hypothetical protein